ATALAAPSSVIRIEVCPYFITVGITFILEELSYSNNIIWYQRAFYTNHTNACPIILLIFIE
ncbi:hypothetical protein, partial [Bacillus cereus]|uniref:hypothetical protein n=1 Tax=Bacillus cereus TaxID=1396 RepID=UPI001C553977